MTISSGGKVRFWNASASSKPPHSGIATHMMDDMHEEIDFDVKGTVAALDIAKLQHLEAVLEASPFPAARPKMAAPLRHFFLV